MAANFFQAPMAGVSLVDEDRVWFKSRVGISVDQTARDAGLCSSAMLSHGVYHLRDAAHDDRALGYSFVTDLGIRFYAAAPLRHSRRYQRPGTYLCLLTLTNAQGTSTTLLTTVMVLPPQS
jgi:hypothetical protein